MALTRSSRFAGNAMSNWSGGLLPDQLKQPGRRNILHPLLPHFRGFQRQCLGTADGAVVATFGRLNPPKPLLGMPVD